MFNSSDHRYFIKYFNTFLNPSRRKSYLLNILEYPFNYEDDDYIYLYKHVRFSNGSLAILKDGTIRFTPPSEFNDPFDCVYGVSGDHFHSAQELKSLISKAGMGKLSPAKCLLLAKRATYIQKKRDG